jgi:thiol-disulfide isomerase/thioredoxin
MQSKCQLLLLFCLMAMATWAQESPSPTFNIGDTAPPLRLHAWLKGKPIQHFRKGRLYVVEFWATWCHPCKVAMPHLSALAREYKGQVTFIGVDIYEKKTTSLEKIKFFVDSMGVRMDYNVAVGDSDYLPVAWLDASGDKGIPKAFLVNAEGRVAWIGHPRDLGEVLPRIVSNTWDVKAALEKRLLEKHLEDLDQDESYELARFRGDPGKPDSELVAIDELLRKEPGLKYMPGMVAGAFTALLKTNPHEAYLFGKEMLAATGEHLPYDMIYKNVESFPTSLPAEIYQLAAEAFRAEIKVDSEYLYLPDMYHRMAEMYRRAGSPASSLQ